jgi:hypothetical protein
VVEEVAGKPVVFGAGRSMGAPFGTGEAVFSMLLELFAGRELETSIKGEYTPEKFISK